MQERGLLFLYASARLFFFRIVRRPRQKAEAFRRVFFMYSRAAKLFLTRGCALIRIYFWCAVEKKKDSYLTEQEMTGGSYENTGIGDRTTFFNAFI